MNSEVRGDVRFNFIVTILIICLSGLSESMWQTPSTIVTSSLYNNRNLNNNNTSNNIINNSSSNHNHHQHHNRIDDNDAVITTPVEAVVEVIVPKARGEYQHRDIEEIERMYGNTAYKNGNFTAAVKACTKCLGLKSRNYIAFSNRALSYLKLKEYSRAIVSIAIHGY